MASKAKKAVNFKSPLACVFCKTEEDDEFKYGKFFHTKQLSVHHNCMFFSSGLQQRKSSSRGLLGFYIDDIKKEVNRGKKLRCAYCKETGATVGCCIGKCPKTFHLPCGIKNFTLHQFFGTFNSYCETHKPVQTYFKTPRDAFYCHICYSTLSRVPMDNCIYATCCKNNWYHKTCIQKYATSAGRYFFKCPMCKNSSDFNNVMETYGIQIPERDASWELEENAFQELYQRPECGAVPCLCQNGKKFDGDEEWELLFCKLCGSKATHRFCEKISKDIESWHCSECKVMEEQLIKKVVCPGVSSQESTQNKYLDKELNFNNVKLSSHASTLLSATSLKQALRCVVQVAPLKIATDANGVIRPNLSPNHELVDVKAVEKSSTSESLNSANTENKKYEKESSVKIHQLESGKNYKNTKRKLPAESAANKKLHVQRKMVQIDNSKQFIKDPSNSKENWLMAKKKVPPINSKNKSRKVNRSRKPLKKTKPIELFGYHCANGNCISKYFGFDCPHKKKNTRI